MKNEFETILENKCGKIKVSWRYFNMKTILDHTKLHQKYFEEMTQIPHGSYHEEAISNYLVAFAKAQGLRYIQDDMFNVIIYKEASSGYEDHEPLVLQAHMDMVCEKK